MYRVITTYLFYYIDKSQIHKIKQEFTLLCWQLSVMGTVILSSEGINLTVAGKKTDISLFKKFIRTYFNKRINFQEHLSHTMPFRNLSIRVKNEMVNIECTKGKVGNDRYYSPSDWDDLLLNKDIHLIDVRNSYEYNMGTFNSAINPETNAFWEFNSWIKEWICNKEKTDTFAIFCTGGIRCEKANNILNTLGYKNIIQLKGGIINYLNYHKQNKITKEQNWVGECFVFDDRVSIS